MSVAAPAAIRLIAGLGNPTRQHERDRHNAGFWLLERYAASARLGFAKDAKLQALVARGSGGAGDLWWVMPQTYMNLSGKSVGGLARFYKILPAEILVAHDELDFLPGTVKLKQGGGVGGHNGLKDIAAQLGSQDFWRLRIGIGHPGDRDRVSDWVLSSPSPVDRTAIVESIDRAIEVLPMIITGDLTAATMKLHSKPAAPKPPRPAAPPAPPASIKE